MAYKKQISIIKRETELKSLIYDGKDLNFNPQLIRTYESQLLDVQKEIQDIKGMDKKRKLK